MLSFSSQSVFRFVICATSLFCAPSLFAQNEPDALNIAAKAIYNGDAAVVRWSPMDWETWKWGNEQGYRLERRTIRINDVMVNGGQYDSSLVVLATQSKPIPESQWEPMSQTNDLAGVAAGTIYGDSLDIIVPGDVNLMTIYHKTQETENRFSFSLFAADQDLAVAKAMGLAYLDSTVQTDYEYAYTVTPYNPPTGTIVNKGIVLLKIDSAYVLPVPAGLRGITGDSTASLQWQRDDIVFTSYIVERSTDGVNFNKINDYPLISASSPEYDDGTLAFTDSLYANGVEFIYRVRGASPFGLVSEPSDTVHVTGKPGPLMVLMSVSEVEETNPGTLKVSWEFPTDKEGKITGFDIYRGAKSEGPFVKLNQTMLSVTEREFVDSDPLPLNFYLVKALDVNGYELQSFPLIGQLKDETPPSIPAAVTGTCDASGIVTLTWSRSPESDVMGYRVYMSTAQAGDYAQVTSVWLNDTVFRYQLNLNTLNEFIYFCVTALDFRQNQSAMSTPEKVERPDIVPPSAPLITSVEPTTQGVSFSWERSSSSDVVRYEFQRKTVGLPGWTILVGFTVQNMIIGFLDSTATKRRWYQYRLVAIDEAGNRGGSRVVKAKPINDGLRDPIQNFTGQLNTGGSSTNSYVLLEWDYGKDVDLIGFQIYRGFDSVSMYSYRFFPVPLPQQQPTIQDMVISSSSNGYQCRFFDFDLRFDIPVKNSFIYPYTDALSPNLAIPPPPQNPPPSPGTAVSYTPTKINYPSSGNPPNKIWYWVMAKFADGSYSPVAGAVIINL